MATSEQKKKLLKAKIAVALHDELGRVPKPQEIEQVFVMARVMYKAVLGLHYLEKAGCARIFTDTASGSKAERKGLDETIDHLRDGDILVVWRLDRLGRSLKHLIETITGLNNRQVGFKSITENIDTTTSGGKLIFHIFGALAEFERDIIRERTQAGLTAARARGRKGGRPRALTPKRAEQLRTLYNDKNRSIREICSTLNISRATLYRYIETNR